MLWLIGIGLLGSIAGVVISYRRAHAEAPATPIGSAAEGVPIRVRGCVTAPKAVVAPCSDRRCSYFRVELRVWSGGGIETRVATREVDFSIDDGTGTAFVIAETARFELVADIFATDRASRLPDRALRVLRELGWKLPEIARVELREAVLELGQTIDVEGTATREPEPTPSAGERGYRENRSRLVFSSDHVVRERMREPRFIGTP